MDGDKKKFRVYISHLAVLSKAMASLTVKKAAQQYQQHQPEGYTALSTEDDDTPYHTLKQAKQNLCDADAVLASAESEFHSQTKSTPDLL